MKRIIIVLLFIIALTTVASAQSSGIASQVRWGATDPPHCIGGRGLIFYNSTSHLLKKCDTTDTWTTIGAGGGGGTGDVVGPGSATDNAIVRFDGTTGKLLQNSAATIADTTGDITAGKYNKLSFTPPATEARLTLIDGTTITGPSATTTLPGLSLSNTFTAKQTITPAVNTNALAVSSYSLTGSNASSLLDLAGTWNTSGVPTLIKANVTNTASGSGSLILDLQVDNSSMFSISKTGVVIASNTFMAASGQFTTGLQVGPTSANLDFETTGHVIFGSLINGYIKVDSAGQNIWHADPNDLIIDTAGIIEFGDAPGGSVRVKLTPASDLMEFYNTAGTISLGDVGSVGGATVFTVDSQNLKFTFVNGVAAFGITTPDASALLTMSSTTLGFLPPRMTTTQRDAVSSPAEGLTVFNLTTHVPNYWNGSAWSAGNGAPYTDAVAIIKGSGDTTKLLRIEVDGFTTGTTRVITPPNADTIIPIATQQLTFAGPTASRTITLPDAAFTAARIDAAQTFTGVQTMTTPSFVTGFTIGGVAASRKIIVGNGTNFVASTETWPVPGTSGNVLTSDGTNWTSAAPAGGGATINATDGVIPYRSSSTVFSDSPITASIPGSMVDGLTITGAATANPASVLVATTGSDSNINLTFIPKGNGVVEQRNGATAQNFDVYGGFTDASNRIRIRLESGGNYSAIKGGDANGSFAGGNIFYIANMSNAALQFQTNDTNRWQISGDGHLLANGSDNAFDIGASGATRPRSLFLGTNATIGSLADTGTRAVLADSNGLLSAPVSDARFKINIQPITQTLNVLDALSKLEGDYFNYNQAKMIEEHRGDFGPQREIGLIYQNVRSVLPELTGTHNGFGFVKYDQMVAFLIEVAKAQQIQITELKAKIH